MAGSWINYNRFHYHETDRKVSVFLFRRTLYFIANNGVTFLLPDGRTIAPAVEDWLCDLGSIPWPFCLYIPRDRYPASFAWHDITCRYGYVWQILPNGKRSKLVVSRRDCDEILLHMVRASKNRRPLDAPIISAGVWVGSTFGWRMEIKGLTP